jgi:hypothetical protein
VDPLFAYGREGPVSGASIAGGVFYETPAGGTGAFPAAMEGDYLFSDWGSGFVKSIDPGTRSISSVTSGLSGPVDLAVGPDGSVYVLEYFAGQVSRIAAASADLAAAITTAPPTSAAHGSVDRASVQITNAGGSDVRGKISIRLLASTDTVGDAGDVLLAKASRKVGLSPDQSVLKTLRFKYPDSLNGTFQLIAEVIPADLQIVEANLANNSAAAAGAVEVSPRQIDLIPRFRAESVTLTASGKRNAALILDVTNAGNVKYRQRIELNLSIVPLVGNPIDLVWMRRGLAVNADGTASIPVRLRLPADLPDGNYTLRAEIETVGALADADPDNNAALIPALVEQL